MHLPAHVRWLHVTDTIVYFSTCHHTLAMKRPFMQSCLTHETMLPPSPFGDFSACLRVGSRCAAQKHPLHAPEHLTGHPGIICLGTPRSLVPVDRDRHVGLLEILDLFRGELDVHST